MFKRLIAYYRPYLSILFLDLICAVVISLIDLSFPLILNFCTRHYFLMPAKQIRQGLFLLGSGLILMYILRALCRYYVGAQGHIMGAMMERDMRADLFDQ
ncbi:MAG: ABC transporter ATP-binding protein, partial [bacterium]